MRLKLRQFDFRADTAQGAFGISLGFQDGLVVIRADNSSGKSTILQGILYALGLEGMLSPSRAIPLPHVATGSLTDEASGVELDVMESSVTLEFENGEGQIATVRRYAKHNTIDTNLVTVSEAPALSSPSSSLSEKAYFVRRSGAAQRDAGFHHWLAKFVGWDLPEVVRYDGGVSPLYLETIFPLFFVEQKHGWAGIKAQTPTYLRIRDVNLRNVEFVLGLSGSDLVSELQLVREKMNKIRADWANAVVTFQTAANDQGIGVRGVPREPASEWPGEPEPSLWLASEDEWSPLNSEISRLTRELDQLTNQILPVAENAAPDVSIALQQNLQKLHEVVMFADSIQREIALEEDQVRSLDSRLVSLHDDLRRSQDADAIRKMGGPMTAATISDCPTCHQDLPSTLLDPASAIVAMPIEKNIQLLKDQIKLFEAMRIDLNTAISAKEQRLVVIGDRVQSLQQSIRAERETLVSAQGSPSLQDVERRVHLRNRIELLEAVASRLAMLDTVLVDLSHSWLGLLQEKQRLENYTTPPSDRARILALQKSFLEQLGEYGFRSLPISQLEISEVSYLPIHEGFDLGFDLSASDMIRTIWAHRIGLLEVGRSFNNHHAKLLIFDEPRQQSTDHMSFEALFQRAGKSSSFGEQVIFATSEPEVSLLAMLEGIPHQYLSYVGKMIQRQN